MKTPDRRALRRIELKNLLSFGPDSPALELENLNILIGANSLSFHSLDRSFRMEEERISFDEQFSYCSGPLTVDGPWIKPRGSNKRKLSPESLDTNQSILTQIQDAEIYPEIAYLAKTYESVRIYQDWNFGRKTIFRDPQSPGSSGRVRKTRRTDAYAETYQG